MYHIQDIVFKQAIISNVFNKAQTEFLLSLTNSINYNNIIVKIALNMDSMFTKKADAHEYNIKALILNNVESRKEVKAIIESANKHFDFRKLKNEMRDARKR